MTSVTPVFILNGPNLNLLGTREPDIYGSHTLLDIEHACQKACQEFGFSLIFRQTQHEGVLIEWIHEAREDAKGLLINAAGYTHTSVGLYDALQCLMIPIIEIHLTLPQRREDFRQISYVSRVASGLVAGFGINSYTLGLKALRDMVV